MVSSILAQKVSCGMVFQNAYLAVRINGYIYAQSTLILSCSLHVWELA